MRRVYFDNNASTPLLPEVRAVMEPYFSERFGNASSIHHHGQETRSAVEHARESVARLLGCRAAEVVFTSGGTEADNLGIFGVVQSGDHVITSTIEHHAVLFSAHRLGEMGCAVTFVEAGANGLADPEDVRDALRPNTKLISVMMANNETGVVQPVEAIGKIAAEAGVTFHTDAVQAAGKILLNVNSIGCHLLAISGHKLHGPQGVGALYVRKGTRLQPLFYGGRHERQRRAGTENVAGIVGLGKAAELAMAGFENGEVQKMASMRDRLESAVLNATEASGVNGGTAPRVPNTTNIYFDHTEGEALIIAMDLKGLAASTGAACSSGATEPSHVLTAMNLTPDRARASIRFSLGKQNTEEEIDLAVAMIPETVARLRELSPNWRKRNSLVNS